MEFDEEKSKLIQKQNAVTGNDAKVEKKEESKERKRSAEEEEDKPQREKEPFKKRPKKS